MIPLQLWGCVNDRIGRAGMGVPAQEVQVWGLNPAGAVVFGKTDWIPVWLRLEGVAGL